MLKYAEEALLPYVFILSIFVDSKLNSLYSLIIRCLQSLNSLSDNFSLSNLPTKCVICFCKKLPSKITLERNNNEFSNSSSLSAIRIFKNYSVSVLNPIILFVGFLKLPQYEKEYFSFKPSSKII
jgi:hypothetical protein